MLKLSVAAFHCRQEASSVQVPIHDWIETLTAVLSDSCRRASELSHRCRYAARICSTANTSIPHSLIYASTYGCNLSDFASSFDSFSESAAIRLCLCLRISSTLSTAAVFRRRSVFCSSSSVPLEEKDSDRRDFLAGLDRLRGDEGAGEAGEWNGPHFACVNPLPDDSHTLQMN